MSKKILFVLTSATVAPWGKSTGYWLEEVAAPYNHLTALGYEIEIASIAGGVPRVDETSTMEPYTSEDTHKFIADPVATAKMSSTRPIEEYVERAQKGEFACVFLPGGHGAAIDFSPSAGLKSVIEGCYGANGVVGAVCHGCAGLVTAIDPATGEPLVKGKTVTGFSDVEETQVCISLGTRLVVLPVPLRFQTCLLLIRSDSSELFRFLLKLSSRGWGATTKPQRPGDPWCVFMTVSSLVRIPNPPSKSERSWLNC